ncbi:hypothetical protein IF1G_06841 [Cordyceps javanica]|uniref:Uncharacterized protein n=1 Tax=Cordyceps javanica TaxID=43265 RepID=A0A545VYB2_9HYPO|nr:hypothetical protein IF1G_06841 [Cordyceps javanica]TQW06699.1 hypothetical protein IF2G_06121 [Cordyceps javanica]
MYGSFGSYSSMSIGSAPMNIYTSVTSRDESCAFPSWPRRASLSSSPDGAASHEQRASSYLSDDDLFLYDEPSSGSGSGSESDDGRSVSSAGSASPPTLGLVLASPARQAPSESEILEMQRQRLNMRKDLIRMVQQEKERRKQASKGRRATASSRKSSSTGSKTRNSTMAPITEAEE